MPTIRYTEARDYDPLDSIAGSVSSLAMGEATTYAVNIVAGSLFVLQTDRRADPILNADGDILSKSGGGVYFDFSDVAVRGAINGGDFGDLIVTGSGGDSVYAAGGNDTIVAGAGANLIDGGSGVNTLSYETSDYNVYVSLNAGLGIHGSFQDQLSNIQNIHGSLGGDLLEGDGAANVIIGGGGYDSLYGDGGDDRLIVSGNSFIDGGDGYDILVLEAGGGAYLFDGMQSAGGGGLDRVEQVNLQDGVTADFTDLGATPGLFKSGSVAEGAGVSLKATEYGEDIRLGKGADTLDAGAGDDRIFVQGGSATIDGGDGYDRLFVQSGYATFTNETLTGVETVVVRSGAGVILSSMTDGMRIISKSEGHNGAVLVGTSGNDVIRLGDGGDNVWGEAGDDRLYGGAGADTFRFNMPGLGRDQVFADLSMDHVSLTGVAASLDDLSFRTSASGIDVVVRFAGLDSSDAVILKGVTLEAVQAAAEDGFFTF